MKRITNTELIDEIVEILRGSKSSGKSRNIVIRALNNAANRALTVADQVRPEGLVELLNTVSFTVATTGAGTINAPSMYRPIMVRDTVNGSIPFEFLAARDARVYGGDMTAQTGMRPYGLFIESYDTAAHTYAVRVTSAPSQTLTLELTYQVALDEITDSVLTADLLSWPEQFKDLLKYGALSYLYEDSDRDHRKYEARWQEAHDRMLLHVAAARPEQQRFVAENEEMIRSGRWFWPRHTRMG